MDWHHDRRKKKRLCGKSAPRLWNLSWRKVKTEHDQIILFTSKHLSPRGLSVMCVLRACVPAQQCVHSTEPGRRWETRGENRGDSKPSHPSPLCPCMRCDFCFMACGCIKPQSNNLVSSGAETTDISHGATVQHCIREPRQHAAVRRHFTLFPRLHSSTSSAVSRFFLVEETFSLLFQMV